MIIRDDGTLYAATRWDEGGHEATKWSPDGHLLGGLPDTHGWARGGGQDITANSDFVFSSQMQAPCGDGVDAASDVYVDTNDKPCTWVQPTRYPVNETWHTVRRYKNMPGFPADNVSESGGIGMGYDWSMTVITTIPWDPVSQCVLLCNCLLGLCESSRRDQHPSALSPLCGGTACDTELSTGWVACTELDSFCMSPLSVHPTAWIMFTPALNQRSSVCVEACSHFQPMHGSTTWALD